MIPPDALSGYQNEQGAQIRFRHRWELYALEQNQQFLRAARAGASELRCLCCDARPRIFVGWDSSSGVHYPKRDLSSTFHAPGCQSVTRWNSREAGVGPPPRYAPSILQLCAAASDVPLMATFCGEDRAIAGHEWENFCHYGNRVFSQAASRAYRETTGNGANRLARFLDVVRQEILEIRFSDRRCAFEIVAQSSCRLSFGVTRRPLVQALLKVPPASWSAVPFCLDELAEFRNKHAPTIWFDSVIADGIVGRTRAMTEILPPPYFFMVIHGAERLAGAVQLYLQPVAEGTGGWCPIESGLERRVASRLIGEGHVFIKPKHVRELAVIPRLPLGIFFRCRYLPDFVVTLGDKIVLLECAGIATPEYLAQLAAKKAYYDRLRESGVRHFTIVRRGGGERGYQDVMVAGKKLAFAPCNQGPLERMIRDAECGG